MWTRCKFWMSEWYNYFQRAVGKWTIVHTRTNKYRTPLREWAKHHLCKKTHGFLKSCFSLEAKHAWYCFLSPTLRFVAFVLQPGNLKRKSSVSNLWSSVLSSLLPLQRNNQWTLERAHWISYHNTVIRNQCLSPYNLCLCYAISFKAEIL